jgi:hypothetical protein
VSKKIVEKIFIFVRFLSAAGARQNIDVKLYVYFLKVTSSCALETWHNKNKIVAHSAEHGNPHLGPTQQPTNNPVALA